MPGDLHELPSLPVHPHRTLDLDAYRLVVDGLAAQPLALSLADLRAFPQTPFDADFVCLEGWVAPDQHWRGVPVRELLERANPESGAAWVQFTSDDFSLPLSLEEAGRALLALDLEGEPLTPEHGAPVRLVVPGGECFTSVKWVEHIELRAMPAASSAETIARTRIGLPVD